tara:strand:- start:731 stop:922 length:192 start_codon:yes stop_codon:yes gene_type:complete
MMGSTTYVLIVFCVVCFVFLTCAAAIEALDIHQQIQKKTAGSRAGDPTVNSGTPDFGDHDVMD